MVRRRRTTPYGDLRKVLERQGDVELGAAARRRRWRNALLVLLAVALLGTAGWLYSLLQPKEQFGQLGKTYPVKVQCTACGVVQVLQVEYGEDFPLICPKCGQRACRRLLQCRVCGKEFLPAPGTATPRCPDCGAVTVGAAGVEEPDPAPGSEPEGSSGNP